MADKLIKDAKKKLKKFAFTWDARATDFYLEGKTKQQDKASALSEKAFKLIGDLDFLLKEDKKLDKDYDKLERMRE